MPPKPEAGNVRENPGGDESFVTFMFAIVSIVVIVLYLPLVTGLIRHAWSWTLAKVTGEVKEKKKHGEVDDEADKPMWVLWAQVKEVPSVVYFAATHPAQIMAGAGVVAGQIPLLRKTLLPRAFWFCFRPRILVLWLWVLLFSNAAYNTLTFDAHAVLGVAKDASPKDIKKAYRDLTRINHPDHNDTPAARAIYPQIKRAYKALIDRDAFDEEVTKEAQFSAGVALPWSLTAEEYQTYILFGLLAVLFIVPVLIWRKFNGSPQQRLGEALRSLPEISLRFEPLMAVLGIPVDPKFVERRREKQELLGILQQVGIPLPADADESVCDEFPSPADFKARCLEPERFRASLEKLGFDSNGMQRLKAFFEAYECMPRIKVPETPFVKTNKATFEATLFLMDQLMKDMEECFRAVTSNLSVMTQVADIQLRSTIKVKQHYDEVVDTLKAVYGYKDGEMRETKVIPRDLQLLIEAQQKRSDLTREVTKEIQTMFKKMQKAYQEQMMQQYQEAMAQQRRRR